MKKLIIALSFLGCVSAHADRYYRGGWVAPLVIGGVIGYEASRREAPSTVIIQEPAPVYVQPTQLPVPPYGYHYSQIFDAQCNCYRTVLMPN